MNKGLLDFLQSASNAVASNVSGPIDLIGMGLNKIGVPVGAAPVGGTEWMKQKGLMRDVEQGPARVMGETAGLLGPALATKFAPQIARGLLQGGENLAAPRRLNKEAGAIVWHGSPHKFDKFDSSKIGTGEGAQAYGHGLYLAESPNVADAYRTQLATNVEVGGKPFYDGYSGKKVGSTGLGEIDDYLMATLGDTNQARKMLLSDARSMRKDNPVALKEYQQIMADLRKVRQSVKATNDGSLYKVDLPDEHIAKMLDWDKPLSQQAPEVQKLIKKTKGMLPSNAMDDLGGDMSLLYGPDLTGADFLGTMNSLQPNFGETVLQRVGVPGVRYLDGGSRGAGQGTSNFVVFPGNEGLLSILERNGQAIK